MELNLEDFGESEGSYSAVDFSGYVDILTRVAGQYVKLLHEKIKAKDAASSGNMEDSISPTSVEINGNIYSIGIEAVKYADFIDEGVDGWANSRGSKYKFKTPKKRGKGDKSNFDYSQSPMVQSIKEWLSRESDSARNVKVGISKRETKGMTIDPTTRAAMSAAYMIKRQGIKPTHFWRDATSEMRVVIKNEFGRSLKLEVIKNLVA